MCGSFVADAVGAALVNLDSPPNTGLRTAGGYLNRKKPMGCNRQLHLARVGTVALIYSSRRGADAPHPWLHNGMTVRNGSIA